MPGIRLLAWSAPAALLAVACSPGGGQNSIEIAPPVALTGATLIDGTGKPPRHGITIVLSQGRIAAVGKAAETPVPNRARLVPLDGAVVTPGFIDMHYHVITGAMRYRRSETGSLDSTYDRALAERLLRVALSRGITTIRDPGASPMAAAVELREDVAGGRVLGPRIFTAGPIISNPRLSDAEIRSAVRAQADAGVNYVKLYAGISPHQLMAAVDESHRAGIQVIGHLQRTSWSEAAQTGIEFLTHAGNWHQRYLPQNRRAAYEKLGGGMRSRIAWLEWLDLEGAPLDTLVRVLTERRVSIDPTLVAYHTKFWWRDSIYQRDPDRALVPEVLGNWMVLGMPTADWSSGEFDRVQAVWPKLLAFVKRLHGEGVLLTVGSDLASPWVIPGVAFHQELALLESAGITRNDVLTMATVNGAKALGIDEDVGTVQTGKRADLVILAASPLTDITATRRIQYVVLNGSLHRPDELLGSTQTARE